MSDEELNAKEEMETISFYAQEDRIELVEAIQKEVNGIKECNSNLHGAEANYIGVEINGFLERLQQILDRYN